MRRNLPLLQQKGWQIVKALHLMLGNGANASTNIFCLCWGAGNTQKVLIPRH